MLAVHNGKFTASVLEVSIYSTHSAWKADVIMLAPANCLLPHPWLHRDNMYAHNIYIYCHCSILDQNTMEMSVDVVWVL